MYHQVEWKLRWKNILYILESNLHPFYSFRGLKNQMQITIACRLDSRSRAGFWKNYGAAVRAVRTIQYNNLLFYLLLIIIYYSSDSPSSLITETLSMLRATSRKVAGLIPDGVIGFFHWHNPSARAMALGLTQPLTEMSIRNISWG